MGVDLADAVGITLQAACLGMLLGSFEAIFLVPTGGTTPPALDGVATGFTEPEIMTKES